MVNSLLRQVMDAKSLNQKDLMEVLGVSLDRVKSLTSGRVKKFAQEEIRAMVEKLHVNGHWLATGEGEMFLSPGEIEFNGRLVTLKQVSQAVASLDLARDRKQDAQTLTYGVLQGNVELVNDVFDRLQQPLTAPHAKAPGDSQLSDDERLLLERYRESPKPLRDAALRVLLGGELPAKAEQVFQAEVGQAVKVSGNLDQTGISFNMGGAKKKK